MEHGFEFGASEARFTRSHYVSLILLYFSALSLSLLRHPCGLTTLEIPKNGNSRAFLCFLGFINEEKGL